MIEPRPKKVAVVFVHGFTGGSSTWTNKDGKKFHELLGLDQSLSDGFDFFEFEYFTQLVDVFKSAPIRRVLKLLNRTGLVNFDTRIKQNKPIKYLSHLLNGYLRTELYEYDEVVLVAHSMGGLIAKDHILNYVSDEGPRPIGYVSMAVPHKGSLASVLLSPLANVNAKEMQPLSDYGDELNTDWHERKDELPRCMYLVASNDECVKETSSIPYKVKTADKFTLDYDHTSICKPDGTSDLVYKRVKIFLDDILYGNKMAEVSSFEYVSDENDFNKEVFVIKLILSEVGEMGVADAKTSFFHAEIISKAARREDKVQLADLQAKVISLYRQTYNSNKHKNADDIFSAVHKELRDQDSVLLMCAMRYINFIHKGGLLHQVANRLDGTVIWDKRVTPDDIRGRM